MAMERNCTLLLHFDKSAPPNEDEIKVQLEAKDVAMKIGALKATIQLMLNGETMPSLLMTVIRFCVPCDDHTVKKLLLLYWEVVDKTGADGKLLPEMILVWYALRRAAQQLIGQQWGTPCPARGGMAREARFQLGAWPCWRVATGGRVVDARAGWSAQPPRRRPGFSRLRCRAARVGKGACLLRRVAAAVPCHSNGEEGPGGCCCATRDGERTLSGAWNRRTSRYPEPGLRKGQRRVSGWCDLEGRCERVREDWGAGL
jgi:hypothetical protein